MGGAPSKPSDQTSPVITHFSHSHPLTLSNINLPNSPCSACNVSGGLVYTCAPCNYILHTTCSMLPLEVAHKTHQHKLSLTFVAPYPGNTFGCNICMTNGSNTWIYRCNECGYDAHLSCVMNIVPPQVATTIHHNQQSQAFTTTDRSAPFTNISGQQQQQPVTVAQVGQQQQQPNNNNNNQPGIMSKLVTSVVVGGGGIIGQVVMRGVMDQVGLSYGGEGSYDYGGSGTVEGGDFCGDTGVGE